MKHAHLSSFPLTDNSPNRVRFLALREIDSRKIIPRGIDELLKEISLTQQSVDNLSKDASFEHLLVLEENFQRQIELLINWIAHYDAVVKKSEHIHLTSAQKTSEVARNETDFIKQKRDVLLSASTTFERLKVQLGNLISQKEEELSLQNGTLLVKSVIPMLQSACIMLLEKKGAFCLYAGSLLSASEELLTQLMSFTESQTDLKAEVAAGFACEVKKVEEEAKKELSLEANGAHETLFGAVANAEQRFFGKPASLIAIPFLNVELAVCLCLID